MCNVTVWLSELTNTCENAAIKKSAFHRFRACVVWNFIVEASTMTTANVLWKHDEIATFFSRSFDILTFILMAFVVVAAVIELGAASVFQRNYVETKMDGKRKYLINFLLQMPKIILLFQWIN